jgi:hypothetical protein
MMHSTGHRSHIQNTKEGIFQVAKVRVRFGARIRDGVGLGPRVRIGIRARIRI